jgi:hypothetical protein
VDVRLRAEVTDIDATPDRVVVTARNGKIFKARFGPSSPSLFFFSFSLDHFSQVDLQ